MLLTLQQDLDRWGPDAKHPQALTVAEAQQYTRKVALGHYENFPVVTWMLPRELRQPFYDVYAFCRWSDDLGDEIESQAESQRLLAWWRKELEHCLSGQAVHPVYVALHETFQKHNLTPQHFHDLITAFERDQVQTRYETFSDLEDYCLYSANPVGRILLELTGVQDQRAFELSDRVCTGLQLINFWQDVFRDWQINRIYLPEEDLRQFGVSTAEIQNRQASDAFRKLLKFQVDRAEQLLNAGEELGKIVPRSIRFDIRLFALGGLRLCEKIRLQNYDVLTSRPRLTKWDIPGLFWKSWRGC